MGYRRYRQNYQRQHTKPYEHKIYFNKVKYSTSAVTYCKTHDVKVPYCVPEFSSSKIVLHCFHFDNNEVELLIGYNIII